MVSTDRNLDSLFLPRTYLKVTRLTGQCQSSNRDDFRPLIHKCTPQPDCPWQYDMPNFELRIEFSNPAKLHVSSGNTLLSRIATTLSDISDRIRSDWVDWRFNLPDLEETQL
ncbi:hypothetical protein FVER53590_28412 [Fusarium verticillioides]|nr:hypothetical protein FVER53590_28412 [Fusarium verticillioides]